MMYYEIHGSRQPLLLLPGGFGSTDLLREILPSLAQNPQSVAVDLQAHGRTADVDRPVI
jgi:hypothetical protein